MNRRGEKTIVWFACAIRSLAVCASASMNCPPVSASFRICRPASKLPASICALPSARALPVETSGAEGVLTTGVGAGVGASATVRFSAVGGLGAAALPLSLPGVCVSIALPEPGRLICPVERLTGAGATTLGAGAAAPAVGVAAAVAPAGATAASFALLLLLL